jgi:hypothetical protein
MQNCFLRATQTYCFCPSRPSQPSRPSKLPNSGSYKKPVWDGLGWRPSQPIPDLKNYMKLLFLYFKWGGMGGMAGMAEISISALHAKRPNS